MSFDPEHLRVCVIRPTLQPANLWSENLEELLMLTAAKETHLGRYLRQNAGKGSANGVARGIYQMEPSTHDDHLSWLETRPDLMSKLQRFKVLGITHPDEMMWNLAYATFLARIHYFRVREPLPDRTNVRAMAEYWDNHWNKNPNHGFPEEAVRDYNRYVLGELRR